MRIFINQPATISKKWKEFHSRKKNRLPWFIFEDNGKSYLMAHAGEDGKLTISDTELRVIFPFIMEIYCCYPKRVVARYKDSFPGIENKVYANWFDGPASDVALSQENGLISLILWDYSISSSEWDSIYKDVKAEISTRLRESK